DVGKCQRLTIINAIANHSYNPSLSLQHLDKGGLIPRQYFGLNIIDSHLCRHRFSCLTVIAGKHINFDVPTTQGLDGLARRILHLVGHSHNSPQCAVTRQENGGLSLAAKAFIDVTRIIRKRDVLLRHEPLVARIVKNSVYKTLYPKTGDTFIVSNLSGI